MAELKEEFKYVNNSENRYVISNYGKVYSLYKNGRGRNSLRETPKLLKPIELNSGYLAVSMYYGLHNYKIKTIHQLVAEHFIDNPNNYTELNHIDEDKTNNRADNLEWCSRRYNMVYGSINKKKANTLKESSPLALLLNQNKWIPKMIAFVNKDSSKISDKVVWIEDGKEKMIFEDTYDAARYFHLTRTRIAQICNHGNSTKLKLIYKKD